MTTKVFPMSICPSLLWLALLFQKPGLIQPVWSEQGDRGHQLGDTYMTLQVFERWSASAEFIVWERPIWIMWCEQLVVQTAGFNENFVLQEEISHSQSCTWVWALLDTYLSPGFLSSFSLWGQGKYY